MNNINRVLQTLGFSKNEAAIYFALVKYGELSISSIATKAEVNRRNVYDSVQRLIEKGVVFEILERNETRLQAVDPNKLREIVEEKERLLTSILPDLNKLHSAHPEERAVYIYRGVEGWRNYMRDILRLGEDFYCIGGKGAWLDSRLSSFTPQFLKEAKRKKISYYHLFDSEVKEVQHEIVKNVGKNFRFLPAEFSTPVSVDIFGNRVNICSELKIGGVEDDMTVTVIVNSAVAEAYRTWFKFMWEACPQ